MQPFDDRSSRRRRRRPAHAGAIALVSFILAAGPAPGSEPVTLAQALEEARTSNPSLLAARQDLEIARGRLVRARYRNPFNPEAEGGLASRRFDGGGSDTQGSAGLSLEIEVAGQRGKRIDEAERNRARVEAEVADAERRIVGRVKEAFFTSLYLRKRLDLFERVEELSRRLRDASGERFEAGEAPKLETNLAAIRHVRSRKDRLAARRDYRTGLRELERLLGRNPMGTIEIAGTLEVPAFELDPDTLVEIALESRPDLRARAAEVERTKAEIALTKRLIAPNPTLRAIYDEETEAGGSRDRIFGGAISVPIPVFDRNQGELVSLAGEHGRALEEQAATALAVETEVRDAWTRYTAAREAVAIFEEEGAAPIRESYGFLETAYREGKIDLLRLISGQNDLIDAELSSLGSVSDYWTAHVALERAIGRRLEEVAAS